MLFSQPITWKPRLGTDCMFPNALDIGYMFSRAQYSKPIKIELYLAVAKRGKTRAND